MKNGRVALICSAIMFALLISGCAETTSPPQQSTLQAAPEQAQQKKDAVVYKGKVVGKSNKAKLISLEVGKGDKAKTLAIKFDDKTVGAEHAVKDHAVIIAYEKRGKDIYATNIKPKIAKLPPGTTEISVTEVKGLIDADSDFELIDSRPGHRYSTSHLPGAISIPVCEMQELIGLLPKDKDKLLIFYCGGPT